MRPPTTDEAFTEALKYFSELKPKDDTEALAHLMHSYRLGIINEINECEANLLQTLKKLKNRRIKVQTETITAYKYLTNKHNDTNRVHTNEGDAKSSEAVSR